MKKLLGAMMGVASAIGLNAAAKAEITPSHMQQLIGANGLSVVGNQASPDGSIHVIAVADQSGWPYAFSLVDMDGDSRKDIVLMLTFVPNRQPSPQFLNSVNEQAASKAFVTEGNATLTYLHLGVGTLDQVTLNTAFSIFRSEWNSYRQMVLQQTQGGSGNFLGVSLRKADPDAIDAGMTRVEVTARDAALTAALNQSDTHAHDDVRAFIEVSAPAADEVDLGDLFALANQAARRQQAQR